MCLVIFQNYKLVRTKECIKDGDVTSSAQNVNV